LRFGPVACLRAALERLFACGAFEPSGRGPSDGVNLRSQRARWA